MPNPSAALGRPDLALLLQDFDLEMDRQGFVGLKVFPRYDAPNDSANAQRIKLASLLEIRNTTRARDGRYNQADYEFEQWYYQCKENGLEGYIDDAKRAAFNQFFDAEVETTQIIYDAVLRNQEQRVAGAVFNTTTFASTTTFSSGAVNAHGNTSACGNFKGSGAIKWSTSATATPIYDVLLAQEEVYYNSGLWPDTVVFSRKTFGELKQCQQIIDRIKFVKDPDTMSTADLANAFNVRQVLVAGGSQNTADKGQSAVIAQIWDPTMCMVCKVAQRMTSPWDPGIGRTFYWNEDGGEVIESYRSNEKRADVVRVRHQTDEKMMYSQAGYLLTGCL